VVADPIIDEEDAEAAASKHSAMKHQAILSIDMATWRAVIEAFNIKESMIEHRREQDYPGPSSRGWYS